MIERTEIKKFCFSPKSRLTNLRQSLKCFNFQENCFFCGEITDQRKEDKKNQAKKRRKICAVTDTGFKDALLQRIATNRDVWGKNIKKRIILVDLISKKAKYHSDCYHKYFLLKPERTTNGEIKKRKSLISDYIEKLAEFMDSSEDCQFILTNLIESVGK